MAETTPQTAPEMAGAATGAMFDQKLKKQAWVGRDFIVRDPDGNGYASSVRPPERIAYRRARAVIASTKASFPGPS